MRQALTAFRLRPAADEQELHWLWLAGRLAIWVWDDETWGAISAGCSGWSRDAGVLALLPMAAAPARRLGAVRRRARPPRRRTSVGAGHGARGDRRRELARVADRVAAFAGDDAEVAQLRRGHDRRAAGRARATGRGWPFSHWSTAVLCNGLGRYRRGARGGASRGGPIRTDMQMSSWAMIELVEAAARCGRAEAGRRPLLARRL
jgi:hypothetical protein